MVKKKETKINIKAKKETKPEVSRSVPSVWNPFEIFDDFSRIFNEDPWYSPLWGFWDWRRPRSNLLMDTERKFIPIDLVDTGKEYEVIAEMPGVNKNDIDVSITENSISICGNVETDIKKEEEGYIRHERSYSTLCRNMRFPEEVNPDKAVASLNDGILELKVTKKSPSTKSRKVHIK